MTRAFTNRRRAEEFDALVSGGARIREGADAAHAELLEVVAALRSAPPVTAREEFVSDLRSRLVVEAARRVTPADDALRARLTPKQRQGARERRAATLLGGFAIVAATGSMAMASQSALPGDVLYPVKRAIENARTNLQSDDAAKAQTLLSHAQTRLDEAQQLTAEGADASTVAATLQDFTDQSSQATELVLDDYAATGDEEGIGELRSFTSESMGELDQLGDVVPSDARAALIAAAQSVMEADNAAFQVCPTCGDGELTQLPEFAVRPSALVTSLLTYGRTPDSVAGISPDYLSQVQEQADATAVKGRPSKHQGQVTPPAQTTEVPDVTDEVTAPADEVPSPLDDLGDQIKDGLDGDHDGDGGDTGDDAVTTTVVGVVNGVGGLVDGLLGN